MNCERCCCFVKDSLFKIEIVYRVFCAAEKIFRHAAVKNNLEDVLIKFSQSRSFQTRVSFFVIFV